MFKLVISDDEGKTTVVPLVHEEVTIGRDEGNRICLTERNVSRKHAKLARLNGTYAVEDLGSYTGVRVNGLKISGASKLKAGDQIGIGDFVLAFHAAAPAQDVASAGAGAMDATDPLAVAMTASQETAILRAPSATKPARLVMLTEPDPGGEYPFTGAPMRIGRFDGAQIWVNHKSISREHAQVAPSGDAFRIQDLGSANGVRVNGKDVRDVELRSGDILELGQVRFRYVAAGEAYTFDPSEGTGQTTALGFEGRSSRTPLYAAIVVLLMGLLVMAFFAVNSTKPTAEPPVASPAPPATAAPGVSDAVAAAAVQDCHRAIAELRFLDGVNAAERVLSVVPTHAAAADCKQQALTGIADREHYDAGSNALRAGDPVKAYEAFLKLSPASQFANGDEVAEAAKQYAQHHLAIAERAARTDPDAARASASAVLSMREVTPEWQRAAQKVLERLGAGAGAGAEKATVERAPRAREKDKSKRPAADTAPARPAEPATAAASVTQQCALAGGDVNSCVVQRLGTSARSAGELSELILAYQAQRDTANMIRTMKRFIELYPNHPKARAYSQVVLRHEGG